VVSNQSAEVVARFVLDFLVARFGPQERIIMDGGKGFNNDFIRLVCQWLDVKQGITLAYTPRGNLAETAVKKIKSSLLAYAVDIAAGSDPRSLRARLGAALYVCRTAIGRTGLSPFNLVYNRQPRDLVLGCLNADEAGVVDKLAWFSMRAEAHRDLVARLQPLKEHLSAKDDVVMARRADAPAARRSSYKVGDKVWVFNYTAKRRDRRAWTGPWLVTGCWGPLGVDVAITVVNPANMDRVAARVSLSRCKPWLDPAEGVKGFGATLLPLEEDAPAGVVYEVQAIRQGRTTLDGSKEFLVAWKGFTRASDSWVSEAELARCSNELLVEFLRRSVFQ
jgi:hypothetical protein